MNEAKPRRKDVVFSTQGSTIKFCYLAKVKIFSFVQTKSNFHTTGRQDSKGDPASAYRLALLRRSFLTLQKFDFAPPCHSERSETESNCEAVRVVRRAESRRGFAQDDTQR